MEETPKESENDLDKQWRLRWNIKGPVSGFVGCQRWTPEFKGITQPVLFMIFFYDFVTPQK